MRLRQAGAERELRVHAVDAGDVRIGDERDRAVAGDELAEPLERAALDVDACGGENDVVDVVRNDVGDLCVERAPLGEQPPELRLVLRERAVASPHALPARVDVDVEPDRQRVPERIADRRRRHRAAAEREHDRPLLDRAKRRLAAFLEDLGNRLAGSRLDEVVRVDASDRASRRRLPRAHEPDERDALLQRIRSMYACHAPTKSPSASPPNFSRAARASSHATAASATTASASTAETSLRSTSAFAASPVSRSTDAERLHQRRERLHPGANDDLLAVRHAALDAAGTVRRATLVGPDLVVRLRPAQLGEREAVADLDALHRLDAHERGGKTSVEPVLLARVRAEPGRDAGRAHLDDAAERVLVLACGVDRRLVDVRRSAHVDPDLLQQRLRDRARGDVHGGMSRRRALECVAHVRKAVLLYTGEIGVAGTRERHRLRSLPLGIARRRPGIHPPRPVLVVAIPDDECERCAERAPLAQSREHLDLVRLDLLARRAAVALLAPAQVGVDRLLVEDEPGGQPREDRDERGTVRLPCGGQLEVHSGKPTALRMTATGAATPVQSSNEAAPCATSTS